jgi:UDP-N-acetylglucosamine 2-epimerase (non-hydrolysing)
MSLNCPHATAIVFGTRPEYLKLKPIIDKFRLSNIPHIVVYINQHTNIDEVFDGTIQMLKIETHIHDRLNNIGSEILLKLPEFIRDCTLVMVQGDTATAFYSAMTGFQMGKQVIHVEAGLRTYDLLRPFPEEGYRQMISRIANIHLCPHSDSAALLKDENVSGTIITVGNTILDLIKSYNISCTMENCVLITFHRRENWGEVDNLLCGLRRLIGKTPHLKYKWYLHPNPELQKKVRDGITDLGTKIELMNPCSHLEFAQQLSKCNFVITDSGGIQEEASFMGKHCIVLRASTERTHIPRQYITVLDDYTKLDEVYDMIPRNHLESCTVYGCGDSADKIKKYIYET